MKKVLGLIVAVCFVGTLLAQNETMYVDGKVLKTKSGSAVTLRGINCGIAEDGNIDITNTAQCKAYVDQMALTGSNSIRFTWYTDGVSWRDGGMYVEGDPTPEARYHKGNGTVMKGFLENGHLSNIFSYCHSKNIIPILSIHDLTCSNDWNYFNNDFANWWKRPSVISFIQEHKEYIIINLANEMGHVGYQGSSSASYNTFKTNYNTLISQIRALGVTVPIIVDAPDCGQSSTELLSIAEEMETADPAHNMIFSAHGYWASYASTQSAIETKLDQSVAKDVCFLFGEIANTQADAPDYCGELDISGIYPMILTEACERNIGWFAWVWNQDCDPRREMSPNSQFNNLTPYGNDIVNNAQYGLKSTSGCGASLPVLAVNESEVNKNIAVYPNPTNEGIWINTENITTKQYALVDISGRVAYNEQLSGDKVYISIPHLHAGFYTLLVNGMPSGKGIVKQ